MPLAITEVEVRVEETVDPESEVETDEDMLEVAKEALYEGFIETEKTMVNTVVHDSLVDTPLVDPSVVVVPFEETLVTGAQVQSDAPGTYAQIDGANS